MMLSDGNPLSGAEAKPSAWALASVANMPGDSINAAPKASAPVAREESLRLPADVCAMICPVAMRITLMLLG
jgi:hypothetical protein